METKTDRELLELAAKAAGLEIAWNPLTDDSDAFRLAVKLKIDIHHEYNGTDSGGIVEAFTPEAEDGSCLCMTEETEGDQFAATRRAIVRAAARIGESK